MIGSNIFVGYGKSHASFGEILQGRLVNNSDFLVTLPIDLWSICNLTAVKRKGPLVINCEYYKSKQVATMLLDKLDVREGYEITISFSRNIPIGKGLSSSTADMLSTIRALQEIFGFLLREKTISEIFISIEPHDGLMFKSCVVYNHRKGKLMKEFLYIPQYRIIAIDFGGEVDTVTYNKTLVFSNELKKKYEKLLHVLEKYFSEKDDKRIAECATESTRIHLKLHKNAKRQEVFDTAFKYKPLGVINTHSGTCLGLVFPKSIPENKIAITADKIAEEFGYPVFVTDTLKLLV